ncbi:hypothetical protein PP505_gp28 [Gordonia phage Dorito]|uniref:Minor tail protein n=1 Tax=Gordonia phage Dorito TaxID=2499023 RepID=A0A3S9UAH2_9CAUD|nr:hypothetical protein PP505_gp28 [Gordonia phage Dorito]AZS07298.1 hypothetical protein PBI_DORITO_28 [Gordonia phage Dorito]
MARFPTLGPGDKVREKHLPTRLGTTTLDGTYAKKWQPATAYTAGQRVISPTGDVLVRTADGTSRASFDATEQATWTMAYIPIAGAVRADGGAEFPVVKTTGDTRQGVYQAKSSSDFGYIWHLETEPGFSGGETGLLGIGNSHGTGGVTAVMVSNKYQGRGITVHQKNTVVGNAAAYGFFGIQQSTAAPLMRLEANGAGVAEALQLVALGGPTAGQKLMSVTAGSATSYIDASTGVLTWQRDVRIERGGSRTARLVLTAGSDVTEDNKSRLFAGDEAITFMRRSGTANTKYMGRVTPRFGGGLSFQTSGNLTTSTPDADNALDAITWTTQIDIGHNMLGFFGATAVTKPTALTAADASTVDATYGTEEAAVITNLRTRVGELETKLKALGLIA